VTDATKRAELHDWLAQGTDLSMHSAEEIAAVAAAQAGTKRCSRPNQKIAQKRRTECSQIIIRYPDPKTSPLHEIGASPDYGAGNSWLVLPVRRYTTRPIHSFIAASSRVKALEPKPNPVCKSDLSPDVYCVG
jgi:hypothetical protein